MAPSWDILLPDKDAVVAAPLVKRIWTWWHTGEESMTPFLKACVASWRVQHPGWEVIVLDQQNIWQYVERSDLPPTFEKICRKSLQSDLVRVVVLAKHGGCYVDASCLALAGYVEAAWELLSSGRVQFVGFKAPAFISDFVSAWFLVVLPGNPVVAEWSRRLNKVMSNRTCDTGAHLDPWLGPVDLREYTSRTDQCAGGWADYLIVNVVLKSILDEDQQKKAAFFASALLVDEGDLSRSAIAWSHILESPPELRFPENERYKMRLLLEEDAALAQRLAQLPMMKLFNSASAFAHLTGPDLLTGRGVVAELVRCAVGEAELRRLCGTGACAASAGSAQDSRARAVAA